MHRLLLIEDDPGAQLLFRNRLQELDFEVVTASTGARGLLEARAGKFDLFLVDIGLGSGIDGYEVCRRLKAVPQIHGVPVVLISGQVKSQEELHRGYEAGCESFLVKGDLTLVEDVVRAMLRIKGLRDELAAQNRLLEERNRHVQQERERGADLELALHESGGRSGVFRDLAAGRPDGILLVDADGVVRMTDRGAQDILGKDIEGRHLANLAPGTGLEAYVRNARTASHDSYRFDLERSTGTLRSLEASIIPTVPRSVGSDTGLRVVLLVDAGKRRVASEMLRLEDRGAPRREMGPLLEAARGVFQPQAFVGKSRVRAMLRSELSAAARSSASTLILGEEGTGKELAARIVHFSSSSSGPFIPVNCSALAPELLERELFGYVKSAFPDAIADRPSLFQQGMDGSIFLDNVGELTPELQSKLVDVLRDRRVRRLGADHADGISVRILSGSRIGLAELVEQGRFRVDLYELLSEIEIHVPLLNKGDEDVLPLAQHFVERFGGGRQLEVSTEAQWVLGEYDWPGNVGELEIAIEVACAHAQGSEIGVVDFGGALFELYKRMSESDSIPGPIPRSRDARSVRSKPDPLAEAYNDIEVMNELPSLEGYERKAILHALRESKGDKLAAAKLLRIGKSTFYRKLKAHGLN